MTTVYINGQLVTREEIKKFEITTEAIKDFFAKKLSKDSKIN